MDPGVVNLNIVLVDHFEPDTFTSILATPQSSILSRISANGERTSLKMGEGGFSSVESVGEIVTVCAETNLTQAN